MSEVLKNYNHPWQYTHFSVQIRSYFQCQNTPGAAQVTTHIHNKLTLIWLYPCMFDKLRRCYPCSEHNINYYIYIGIVRESKSIVKCYDEMYGDIMISDELRKMLLQDNSDNYEVYSEKDRSEFLFCIFKHICLGGSVCQVIFDCVTLHM